MFLTPRAISPTPFYYILSNSIQCLQPYHLELTHLHPILEAKQDQARLVLGWETAREYQVVEAFKKNNNFMCAWGREMAEHTCHRLASVALRGQLEGGSLLPPCVSQSLSQVIRLDGKCLYQMSHLTGLKENLQYLLRTTSPGIVGQTSSPW